MAVAFLACEPVGIPIGNGSFAGSWVGGTAGRDGVGGLPSRGGAGGADEPPCPVPDFSGAVAYWAFDEDLSQGRVRDLARGNDGALHGTQWTTVTGRNGCGQAVHFQSENDGSYVEVSDSPDFDLETGSIDFFINVEQCNQGVEFGGLVSRDASRTETAGHLQVRLSDMCAGDGVVEGFEPNCSAITEDFACRVTVRVQTQGTPGTSYYVTSDQRLPLNRWVHVGINFGDVLELHIDGELDNATVAPGIGIAGNDLPLLLGASNSNAKAGRFLKGVSLDEVRISSVPRSF